MARKSKRVSTGRSLQSDISSMSEPRRASSGTMSMGGLGSEGGSRMNGVKDMLIELSNNPTVRYMAAGLATAMLTRLANNISEKYPEISTFLKENIETVETKLDEFKNNLADNRH